MPKGPMGQDAGPMMGPPWMRGPGGPAGRMGRMPTGPMPGAKPQGPPWAGRQPFGPQPEGPHARGDHDQRGHAKDRHDADHGPRREVRRGERHGRIPDRAEDVRAQMLRRKLMEMEMRIRRLEAEVRRLRADD